MSKQIKSYKVISSSSVHLDSQAVAKLERFFSSSVEDISKILSVRFVNKHQHWCKTGSSTFSRIMKYRLKRLDSILNCNGFSDMRVFDAGTGFGLNALMLALAGASKVVASDILPGRIKDLTQLIRISGLQTIVPVCCDYTDAINRHGQYGLWLISFDFIQCLCFSCFYLIILL